MRYPPDDDADPYQQPPRSGRPRHAERPSGHLPYGQPSYGQPANGQPSYGQPAYGEPANGQPSYGEPSYGQLAYGEPAYGRPRHGPAPHGQPPYDPYGDSGEYPDPGGWGRPPRRAARRRRPRLWVSLPVLVLLILALVVVPTLTGRTALDPRSVQHDVGAQFQRQQGVSVDLRCADRMTVDPGSRYRCAGTTSEGEQVIITITITDRNANYTWAEG